MSYQGCSEVLRDACALTLRDEPLVGRVEHGPMQLWVEVAQLCIPLHHPVHSEVREQPTRRWQSRIQQLLKNPMQWHLPLCGPGLQQSHLFRPDADKPAFGWVKKGTNPTLKTTSGRARVNIHGALNLETFDTPFVAPITVDGVSAVQLLAKIEARNQDKRIIHVIWDNAAYHKGPDVRAFLSRKNCRIHLIQLPPYCPHLNPIERLWAVMHQHVTHNRAYPTQKLFTEAILKFFRKIIPEQWHNFRNQVTDNFRIISEQNLRVLE